MNVRKIGLRAGMAFLLILLLFTAGCGRQAQEEVSAPEKTVVTLWHYWDIPACQQTLSKLVKTFNASQDRITVEIKYVPDEDFKKQLALSMADGTMPDIAVVDSSDFRFFHNMKHFADLTGKLEVLPEYLPQAMEPCEIDGRVYGLPFGMNCPALIYNKQMLEEAGFTDTESIVTSKNTYVAPFVNAEEAEYLVIEDAFPNGRPLLEKAGVMFTARDTVEKVERMKVCTCLNPLHTTLAVYGCLLGYTKISEEMKDADLVKLVEIIGYKEGLPVVTDPGILSPKKFIDEVLQIRVPNPFMPDTPQRIACDTSQKLSIRFGETIKEYMARPELDVKSLKFIPMVQAGWCRYLLGVDDEGNTFTVSPDPMYEGLAEKLQGVRVGEPCNVHEVLQPILSDAKIFGVDLYEAGLGEYVESIFAEMTAGRGAVRAALQKHLAEA